MAPPVETFKSKAPAQMGQLIRDFSFSVLDAAAVMGNAGHECNGLTTMQEVHPVGGGRGGLGWFQWTGPRRQAFEAYCSRMSLNTASDQANYGFLFSELKGPESAAVERTRAANGLDDKVKTFELAFERAGVPAFDSRIAWANRALDAWNSSGIKVESQPDSSTGDASVKNLQRKLTQLGYALGDIDGKFGSHTRDAVAAFQSAHGLPVSGLADAATLRAVDAALAQRGQNGPGVPARDDALRAFLVLLLQRIASQGGAPGTVPDRANTIPVLQALFAELAKQASTAQPGTLSGGAVPISMSTPPVLTSIDKLFPASEALAGKKTALAVIAYVAMTILKVAVPGILTGGTSTVLTALIGGFGGLGLLSKFDRVVKLMGVIAAKPPLL